jgi:hypothetical protein
MGGLSMTKIYESDVRAGNGNSGEYVQVTRRDGTIVARTIELYVHGSPKVGRWEPATLADLSAANAPRAWDREIN